MRTPNILTFKNISAPPSPEPTGIEDLRDKLEEQRLTIKVLGVLALGTGILVGVNVLRGNSDYAAQVFDAAAAASSLAFAHSVPERMQAIDIQLTELQEKPILEVAA